MKTEIIKIDVIAWQLKIALLFAILCFGIGMVTAIPQQDYTLYGTATLNGKVLTAQDDAVISLEVEGIELVSYTMGDIPGTDNYVLIVPLDSEPRVTTAAQEGDTAYIFINGIPISEGAQVIGTPGTTVQFDISAKSVSKVTVLYPNGGESIPVGTQVQVSARATDDKGETGVAFYYSSDGGSNWNLIGEGAKVFGTNKDGVWDKAWDTDGLSAGTNYLLKAVASDGTLTSDDQSDSTFSLTSSKVIRVPVDYPTIQGAVDAARAGNTIIVGDGIYTENVKVNKSLTIKSTSGNPADTIVLAADPDADVFSVTADYVNIRGLTVQGANGWLRAGIQLNSTNNCIISNNNASNNFYGIQLQDSSNNSISGNICRENDHTGIRLLHSTKNDIADNTCYKNYYNGVLLTESPKNEIERNTLKNNEYGLNIFHTSDNIVKENICKNNIYGIRIGGWSSNNCIYLNDFINNADTVHSLNSTNFWNSPSKITYTYNGNRHTSNLGNYWDDYTGTDANGNGIGDTPYGINTDKDFYPLLMPVENYIKQPTITVDTTPPVITCPADVTVELETVEGAVVPLEATATDNCDPNPIIASNELDIYPPGTTIVTFTATDASGNSASCSTNVTVYGPKEIEQRIWPSEAPGDTCKDGAGNPHSTTGENSADWFFYGGAGDWKIFDVTPGTQIHIHSRGDSCPGCVLWHINYYLDDYYGGTWHEVTFIDGPDQKGAEHDYYYVPIGDRVRIRATSGFYVAVYGPKEIEQRIWPSEAPVDTCKDGAGNPHSTTGENSADWFLYGGAGDWKIFDVTPGTRIHIHSRGDSCPGCVLWHINYYLDDYYGGAWHEVTFIDGPDQKGAEHDYYYVPIGDRVRIRATSGFYVAVYGLKFSDGEKIVPSSN